MTQNQVISSTSNQTVKRIRALHHRKERDETGCFFVEGIRIVGEAAQLGAEIDTLVIAPNLIKSDFARDIIRDHEKRGGNVLEVTPAVFESLSSKEGPQGIGAVIRQRWENLSDVRLTGESLCWIAIDSPQDPGNIGTMMRTADAVGAAGIILLGRSAADPYDPNAVRASMGALFSQRLVRAEWNDFVGWKRKHHYFVVGTSDAASKDYQKITYQPPLILLMGSERHGLSEEQKAACDALARIPMVGRSDSLNLAVATGVMLYEIFNQHRR